MNCLLLTAFYDPQNDNNFWNFRLGQISHAILSHCILGGRGIGEGVRENNAYCFLLRMAHLLTFIYNSGIWKGTIQSRLKNGTHFSCYESVPKGYNVQMSLCFTQTWGAMSRNGQRQGSVVQQPLPQKKSPSTAQLKSLFGDSCLLMIPTYSFLILTFLINELD